jgi:NAD(P)-dependent dehydrogenase (short-subunit alcohol dehydrogenase family)
MNPRLADQIAIVSGAANGIGRAISRRLAAEGAWVLVTDIDEQAGQKTVEEIRSAGGAGDFHRVDINCREAIQSAVATVAQRFGKIDILCNNAAYIAAWHDVLHATDEEWEGCLRGTILGTQRFTQTVLPWMIPQQRGDHHHLLDPGHGCLSGVRQLRDRQSWIDRLCPQRGVRLWQVQHPRERDQPRRHQSALFAEARRTAARVPDRAHASPPHRRAARDRRRPVLAGIG